MMKPIPSTSLLGIHDIKLPDIVYYELYFTDIYDI